MSDESFENKQVEVVKIQPDEKVPKWKRFLKKAGMLFLKVVKWFFIISIVTTIIFRWLPVPITPLMIKRCGQQLFEGKSMTLKKDWVPMSSISPHLPLALVCSEDQKFMDHFGFDFEAIEDAMEYNEKQRAKGKKRVHGASTITQQTAKNVFLIDIKWRIRKVVEAYFSLLIEVAWSKERIMEVYLNVIEFGDGIYGAEAAAKFYFNKSAINLTREEAALLAAVVPNPRVYNAKSPSSYIIKRQRWILRQMNNWGSLSFD
jgi:monofunctional glycosyltransferase